MEIEGEDLRITAWIDAVHERGASRQGLRAHGSLKLDSPNGSGRVREVVLVERPSRLRLESLNLLGQTQALLVTDGHAFAYFDGHELERGNVSTDLLRERIGIDLSPDETVAVLLAAPTLDGEIERVMGRGAEREVRLGDSIVRFNGAGELLGIDVMDAEEGLRWRANYRDWNDVPGGRFPTRVELYFPATGVIAQLELKEIELNPTLQPSLFRLGPVGAK